MEARVREKAVTAKLAFSSAGLHFSGLCVPYSSVSSKCWIDFLNNQNIIELNHLMNNKIL